MMIKLKLALAASLLAAFAAVGCGSSSSNSPGSSSSGIFCSVSTGATTACSGTLNVPSADESTYKSDCTKGGGTIVDSCPTKGLIGCCTEKGSSNYSVVSCTYGVSTDAGMMDAGAMGNAEKTACQNGGGTWSTSP
jgi:hypothetical protein